MKVSKAIEILVDFERGLRASVEPDVHNALKLGIEALKRHQGRDYTNYNGMHELLPGETPEQDVK